jgi:Clostripain family
MAVNVRRNGNRPARTRRNPKWTVLVYLAGDNNLTSNCITVLQQLEAVKYRRNVRVLACFDSNTPWPKGSRYLAINGKWRRNNADLDWEIYNDLIITEDRDHKITPPDFCENAKGKGSRMTRTYVSEGLRRFLRWAMRKHSKSNRYMLVLYGHGPVVAGKTFLAQENPLSSLRMKDLPEILDPYFGGRRPKLDILALQNCAMNGVETAYEVRDHVKYMIGSQGLVLAYGWPYETIVGELVNGSNNLTLSLTKKILKACARHLIDFSVMDRSSEQSVCDLSKLEEDRPNITDAIRELSRKLREALIFKPVPAQRGLKDLKQQVLKYPVICDAVRLARLEAQSYWGENFVDIYDFCERLLKKCNEAILVQDELISSLRVDGGLKPQVRETDLVVRLREIIGCCMRVIVTVREMVPYSYYIGPELQYSRGLSIYFPWSMPGEPYSFFYRRQKKEHVLVTAFETYSGYEFVKKSEWARFLKSFYGATLRKVRRADRDFSMLRDDENLVRGMVHETFKAPGDFFSTDYLQKTDSNSGSIDPDVGSNVKNYPRRNYLSPSDCPRKVKKPGRYQPGKSPDYENRLSPPVSYLGWNISEFVADVIRNKAGSGNNGRGRRK